MLNLFHQRVMLNLFQHTTTIGRGGFARSETPSLVLIFVMEKALLSLLGCNKIAGDNYHPRYKRGRKGREVV